MTLDRKRLLTEVAGLPPEGLEELQSLIREHFPDIGNSSRSPLPEGVERPISPGIAFLFTRKINDALSHIIAQANILLSDETHHIKTCLLLLNLQSSLRPDSLISLNGSQKVYNQSLHLPFNLKRELDFFINKITVIPDEDITKTTSKAMGNHISKRETQIISLMKTVGDMIGAFEEGENSILKKYNFNISNDHDKYLLMLRLIIEYSYPLLEMSNKDKIKIICTAILSIITNIETASADDDERNLYVIEHIADHDYISNLMPDNDIKNKKEITKNPTVPSSFYNEKYLRLLLFIYHTSRLDEKGMPMPVMKTSEFNAYYRHQWMLLRSIDAFWIALKHTPIYAPMAVILYFTISSLINYFQDATAINTQFDMANDNLTVSCPEMTNGTANGTWPLTDYSIDYGCYLYINNLQLYNDTCCLGLMTCLALPSLSDLESACNEWFDLQPFLSFYVCLFVSIGLATCAFLPILSCLAGTGLYQNYADVSVKSIFKKYMASLIGEVADKAPTNHRALLKQFQDLLGDHHMQPSSEEVKAMLQTLAAVAPTTGQHIAISFTGDDSEQIPLLSPPEAHQLRVNF